MTLTILSVLFSVVLFGVGFLAGSTSANMVILHEREAVTHLQTENDNLRDRLMAVADEKLKEVTR